MTFAIKFSFSIIDHVSFSDEAFKKYAKRAASFL
jgi:hypothetical protein